MYTSCLNSGKTATVTTANYDRIIWHRVVQADVSKTRGKQNGLSALCGSIPRFDSFQHHLS
jgi:hypothetical protein